jgi:hypothetical protein
MSSAYAALLGLAIWLFMPMMLSPLVSAEQWNE